MVFAGLFLSGCTHSPFFEGPAMKDVGAGGLEFKADTTDELKILVAGQCRIICPNMEYEYVETKYTVYEEDGMYVARDPRCICYDPNYERSLGKQG
jgi:hypothetical protein